MAIITNDVSMNSFKHKIMEEVCRLAWDSNLNEDTKAALVEKIIPGPKPIFRCCIYKEREIVRENDAVVRNEYDVVERFS